MPAIPLLPDLDSDTRAFVEGARDREAASASASSESAPRSGRPRRLVAAVGDDVFSELEKLKGQTGAPVAFHVDRLLRTALGL